jgi:Glycosyl transferase family 2
MRAGSNLAGLCILRNARDLIALVCGHYLRIGLAHIRFIDDGSTDGSYEFLSRLAHREKRISLMQVSAPIFRQQELISEAANDLQRRGFTMILPFDIDEFWLVSGPQLEVRYARHPEISFSGRWINFVQNETATQATPARLLSVKYSAPALGDVNQDTVTSFRRPFVCFSTRKVAFKATRPVQLDWGQHALITGPECSDPFCYEIFHLPLRCRSEILTRGLDHEPRRALLRNNPTSAWQSLFFREAVLANRTDELWHTNSADSDGCLNCGGERIQLVRDYRLRSMLLKAAGYLALRYPWVLI